MAMGGPPELPQELWDSIVDDIYFPSLPIIPKRDLAACALASRHLLPRAHTHLFNCIQLKWVAPPRGEPETVPLVDRRVERLRALIHGPTPTYVFSLVRTLVIDTGERALSLVSWTPVVSELKNLRTLGLRAIRPQRHVLEDIYALVALPTLTELSLGFTLLCGSLHIADILARCTRGLKVLELSGSVMAPGDTDNGDDDNAAGQQLTLRELRFSQCPAILSHFSYHDDLTRRVDLSCLRVLAIAECDGPCTVAFISRYGPWKTLETLGVENGIDGGTDDTLIRLPEPQTLFPSLTHIQTNLSNAEISGLLAFLPLSPRLTQITIYTHQSYHRGPSISTWWEGLFRRLLGWLDTEIDARPRGIEHLHVVVRTVYPTPAPGHIDGRPLIEDACPLLRAKGILKIETDVPPVTPY
ncbi:hypothetical protein C8F01DRAFT_1371164 [Mycena amicta]|nr:hypothetical protein C8F01DRAFT_1371164 [Mycena amicta]